MFCRCFGRLLLVHVDVCRWRKSPSLSVWRLRYIVGLRFWHVVETLRLASGSWDCAILLQRHSSRPPVVHLCSRHVFWWSRGSTDVVVGCWTCSGPWHEGAPIRLRLLSGHFSPSVAARFMRFCCSSALKHREECLSTRGAMYVHIMQGNDRKPTEQAKCFGNTHTSRFPGCEECLVNRFLPLRCGRYIHGVPGSVAWEILERSLSAFLFAGLLHGLTTDQSVIEKLDKNSTGSRDQVSGWSMDGHFHLFVYSVTFQVLFRSDVSRRCHKHPSALNSAASFSLLTDSAKRFCCLRRR